MKKTQLGLILGLTSTIATLSTITPAHSLTWTVNSTVTNPATTILGSFTIDDESLGSGATLTASNVTVGSVTYDNSVDLINVSGGSSVTGVSWDIFGPTASCTSGGCNLSLNFESPFLTTSGGTLDLTSSTIFAQPFGGGLSSSGATTFSGGATAPRVVPFNFSTTPGLVVVGLITGVAKGKRHFPKIKKKIASWLKKK